MKTKSLPRVIALLLAGVAVLVAGCSEWRYDVSEMGIPFRRVTTGPGGQLIGEIAADTAIAGRPCRRGWVHVHPNGVPAGFMTAQPIELGTLQIPAGTWIWQGENGVVKVCAFPRDTQVQGHLCRGTGGPKGVQAAFYPSGALKQYFLRHDTRIQGILCRAGVISSAVELHENGRLKSCELAEEVADNRRSFRKGTRLRLDPDGRILR